MGETSEEMKKTIIFLHGFFASGSCVPATALKEAFEGKYNVLTPDLPLHPHDALAYVQKLCEVYDSIAHFEPMFLEHYEVSYHFPGAHTPTAEEIKAYHVPLIEKMMKEKDPMEWEVLESEYLYKRPWLTARREHVKLPTGAEIQDVYVLEYPEFCNVIAITKDGKFLMERQYRHAQHLTGIEIPAGAVVAGELTKTSGCALH